MNRKGNTKPKGEGGGGGLEVALEVERWRRQKKGRGRECVGRGGPRIGGRGGRRSLFVIKDDRI